MKGQQPFHYSGHPNPGTYQDISAILDLLLVAGAGHNSKTGDGEISFNIACRTGRVVNLNALLVFGITTSSSHAIHSSLEVACRKGDTEIVQLLLLGCSRICCVCGVGSCGESPLRAAIINQDRNTVQTLLHKAVDLEVKGEGVLGPLYQAFKEHNLWVAPLIQRKETSGESLIVGDLLTRGPLFPMRKSLLPPVAPTTTAFRPLLLPDDANNWPWCPM